MEYDVLRSSSATPCFLAQTCRLDAHRGTPGGNPLGRSVRRRSVTDPHSRIPGRTCAGVEIDVGTFISEPFGGNVESVLLPLTGDAPVGADCRAVFECPSRLEHDLEGNNDATDYKACEYR
jgi:hypothetical protein